MRFSCRAHTEAHDFVSLLKFKIFLVAVMGISGKFLNFVAYICIQNFKRLLKQMLSYVAAISKKLLFDLKRK